MPGISFIADLERRLTFEASNLLSSLPHLMHQGWESKTLAESAEYFLGVGCYKEYPVYVFDDPDYIIAVEGKIYGKHLKVLSEELFTLAHALFTRPKEATNRCKQWVLNTDGDFLIFIIHKRSSKIWVLNDLLGRLPTYYCHGEHSIIISREVRFVTGLQRHIEFDRMAVAHYLLFGYPIGTRTLLKDIDRLEPASLASISPEHKTIQLERLYEFNFDETIHSGKSVRQNVDNLVALFSESCKTRASLCVEPARENIVALSGGLDSRSVAGCLAVNGIPFTAVTRLDSSKMSSVDAKIARVLAERIGVPWCSISIGSPEGGDILELLRLKNGMNSLGMVSRVQFLNHVQATYGSNINFFTGDGGDKIFKDLTPPQSLKTLDELAQHTISENEIFALESVATMTGISADKITDDLNSHLARYPEANLENKYARFLVFERGFKLLFEGEDRNRCYFWHVAPFYSIPLFHYAMGCSPAQKQYYVLYRQFLMRLSPQLASIDNANWGLPISSKASIPYLILKQTVRRLMHRPSRKLKPSQARRLNFYTDCIAKQLSECPAIKSYLPSLRLGDLKMTNNESRITTVLTLTSAIEDFECGKSSLSGWPKLIEAL